MMTYYGSGLEVTIISLFACSEQILETAYSDLITKLEKMDFYVMEEDASYIHEGGTSYNNGKNATEISWVSYPHFFKDDNIIVLYVGEDLEIINALKEIVSLQFAGYKGMK